MNIGLYSSRPLAPGIMLFMRSLRVTLQHWVMLWQLTRSHYQLTRACANPSSAGTAIPITPVFSISESATLQHNSHFFLRGSFIFSSFCWHHLNRCTLRCPPWLPLSHSAFKKVMLTILSSLSRKKNNAVDLSVTQMFLWALSCGNVETKIYSGWV